MKQVITYKRIFLLLLSPVSLLLIILAKKSSFFAEQIYAKHFYKWISQILSTITGVIPFSLAEMIVIVVPVVLLAVVIRFLIRIIVDKVERRKQLLKGILNLLCSISVVLFLFTLFAGINYYRYPFSVYSNLTIGESSLDELYALTESLAIRANELRAQVTNTDENGVFQLSESRSELGRDANIAYVELGKEYPVLRGNYGPPKSVVFSKYMSNAEITGMFFPFTMEANINVDIPDYSIPSTMLHELAHLRGFMREDEANYLAYLSGIESDSVEFQYSSTMLALIISANALYEQSREDYFVIKAMYSQGVLNDISMNSSYWKEYKNTVVSRTSNHVNNMYLKANDQSDGVKSYGRMLDLLLAKYRKDNEVKLVERDKN